VNTKPPNSFRPGSQGEDALRQRDELQAQAQREFEEARRAHFQERRKSERRNTAAGQPVTVERRRADRRR
jgi:hypothetical protein